MKILNMLLNNKIALAIVAIVILAGVYFAFFSGTDVFNGGNGNGGGNGGGGGTTPTGTLIFNVLDTQGGTGQDDIEVEAQNGSSRLRSRTHPTGRITFVEVEHRSWDISINGVFVEEIHFFEDSMELFYYLDEI